MRQRLVTLGRRPSGLPATLALLLPVFLLATLPATPQEGDGERIISVGEELIFGSDVTVVTVPVTVTDRKGNYVDGLEMYDFKIFDNKTPQTIDSFEVAFLPISLVICVQSSSRVEGILPDIRDTAILFTEMVLGEFGQAAVIAFDQRIRLLPDRTHPSPRNV